MQILFRIFTGWAKAFYSTGNLKNTLFKTNHPKKPNQSNLSEERSIQIKRLFVKFLVNLYPKSKFISWYLSSI